MLAISAMISVIALAMNKRSNSKIDDADWIAPFVFSLQIFDFISDLNLTIEIALKWMEDVNIVLFICAVGCAFFVLLPYVVNLCTSARIKTLVFSNHAAVSYFEHNSAIFVFLCVISGSAYSALQLVSSRLFNLDIFNAGIWIDQI